MADRFLFIHVLFSSDAGAITLVVITLVESRMLRTRKVTLLPLNNSEVLTNTSENLELYGRCQDATVIVMADRFFFIYVFFSSDAGAISL